ncbi:unnamed protein product [Owenia fusiformis]|uniref:Gustatory receptor n=1 Tax=Owenia fusiformis TaxID=6347 RepID=A0A8S4PLP6_OWEFU|nr:unnamed protein product [Owenia fusiformis]
MNSFSQERGWQRLSEPSIDLEANPVAGSTGNIEFELHEKNSGMDVVNSRSNLFDVPKAKGIDDIKRTTEDMRLRAKVKIHSGKVDSLKPLDNSGKPKSIEDVLLFQHLKPLFTVMSLHGLFFHKDFSSNGKSQSNRKRTLFAYCTGVLIIAITSFLRSFTSYRASDSFGYLLFFKIIISVWWFEIAVNAITCWRGSYEKDRLHDFFMTWHKYCNTSDRHGDIPYKDSLKRCQKIVLIGTAVMSIGNTFTAVYARYHGDPGLLSLYDVTCAPFTSESPGIEIVRIASLFFHWVLSNISFYPFALYIMICYVLCKEFQIAHNNILKCFNAKGDIIGPFEERRRDHQKLCKLTEVADKTFMVFVISVLLTHIPLSCLFFYNMIYNEIHFAMYMGYTFWILVTFINMGIVCIAGAFVNNAAHAPLTDLHSIRADVASTSKNLEIHMFLSRLTGTSIGLTAMDMFVMDKPTTLTVLGLLITYFFLLLQFHPMATAPGGLCLANLTDMTLKLIGGRNILELPRRRIVTVTMATDINPIVVIVIVVSVLFVGLMASFCIYWFACKKRRKDNSDVKTDDVFYSNTPDTLHMEINGRKHAMKAYTNSYENKGMDPEIEIYDAYQTHSANEVFTDDAVTVHEFEGTIERMDRDAGVVNIPNGNVPSKETRDHDDSKNDYTIVTSLVRDKQTDEFSHPGYTVFEDYVDLTQNIGEVTPDGQYKGQYTIITGLGEKVEESKTPRVDTGACSLRMTSEITQTVTEVIKAAKTPDESIIRSTNEQTGDTNTINHLDFRLDKERRQFDSSDDIVPPPPPPPPPPKLSLERTENRTPDVSIERKHAPVAPPRRKSKRDTQERKRYKRRSQSEPRSSKVPPPDYDSHDSDSTWTTTPSNSLKKMMNSDVKTSNNIYDRRHQTWTGYSLPLSENPAQYKTQASMHPQENYRDSRSSPPVAFDLQQRTHALSHQPTYSSTPPAQPRLGVRSYEYPMYTRVMKPRAYLGPPIVVRRRSIPASMVLGRHEYVRSLSGPPPPGYIRQVSGVQTLPYRRGARDLEYGDVRMDPIGGERISELQYTDRRASSDYIISKIETQSADAELHRVHDNF